MRMMKPTCVRTRAVIRENGSYDWWKEGDDILCSGLIGTANPRSFNKVTWKSTRSLGATEMSELSDGDTRDDKRDA